MIAPIVFAMYCELSTSDAAALSRFPLQPTDWTWVIGLIVLISPLLFMIPKAIMGFAWLAEPNTPPTESENYFRELLRHFPSIFH